MLWGWTKDGGSGDSFWLVSHSCPYSAALWSDHLYPQHVGADETEAGAEQSRDSPVPPVCAEELRDSPVPPVCAEELVGVGLEPPPQAQEQLLLSEQLHRVQTMEDVESLAKEELVEEQEEAVPPRAGKRAQRQEEGRAGDRHSKKTPAKRKMISLEAVLDGKPQEMDCPSLPVVLEEEVSRTGLPRAPQYPKHPTRNAQTINSQ